MTARRRSRLVLAAQRCFLEYFVAGTSARGAAGIIGINRNTAALFCHKFREIIARQNRPGHRRKSRRLRASQARWSRPCRDDPRRGKREAGSGKREAHVAHSKENTSRFNRLFRRVAPLTGRLISLGSFMKGSAMPGASARAKPYQRHRGLLETGEASLNINTLEYHEKTFISSLPNVSGASITVRSGNACTPSHNGPASRFWRPHLISFPTPTGTVI